MCRSNQFRATCHTHAHARHGFSLVEVLCALAIASLSLVALFRGLGQSQSAALYMDAHLGARILAQSILEDERKASVTSIGTRRGTTGLYDWILKIDETPVEGVGSLPASHHLYRLAADITWLPRGRLRVDTVKFGR
jgi:prepilin-type N-terminal cleavage/methylation domain-containing protein